MMDDKFSNPTSASDGESESRRGSGSLWVADITYIAIAVGFVYLAAILDAWSRRVVGYAIGRRIDARLALAALRAAITSRQPPLGCIHHSDSEYAAEDYRAELEKHGLKGSMARRGNPYDNAKAESFMKTLKVEEVYLMEYDTFEDVVASRAWIAEPCHVRRGARPAGWSNPRPDAFHPQGCTPDPMPSRSTISTPIHRRGLPPLRRNAGRRCAVRQPGGGRFQNVGIVGGRQCQTATSGTRRCATLASSRASAWRLELAIAAASSPTLVAAASQLPERPSV